MTVYEIPNIEHCTVTEIKNGTVIVGYQIVSNTGWYIHINDGAEDTANIWKTAVVLLANRDFSQVIICAEADLPEGAEICGTVDDTETV